jgi:hypothetical protein
MSNGIYDILGKLASVTPKEESKQETSKPIYESVEARGSMLEGVTAIEAKLQKEFVAEKAVSTAQQKFMGMVHATQKGEKAPSKEVAKVAKSMGKKDAKDYASTKHKGLPAHVDEAEMDETLDGGMGMSGVCAECSMPMESCGCDHEEMAEASYVHKGTYGNSYNADDDEDDAPKGKGRPKKADSEKSSANLPWGGNPPKDTYKHQAGSRVHTISDKSRNEKADAAFARDDKKSKVHESINYKKLTDDNHMTLDEMITCLQDDIRTYKQSGEMSESLRDFLDLHRHSRKQADEAIVMPSPTDVKFATPAVTRKAAAPAGDNSWMINQQDFAQKEKEMPTTKAGLAHRSAELGLDEEQQLKELAKLAGLTDEGNEFSGELAKARAQHKDTFSVDGKEYPVTEADAPVDEPTTKPVNAPKQKYSSMKSSTMNPGEGDSGEKRMYPPHPTGDNGMTEPARKMPIKNGVKEDIATLEGRLAAEYESIKKVSK